MNAHMHKLTKLTFHLIILLVVLGLAPMAAVVARPNEAPVSLPGPTIEVRLDPQIRQRYVPPPAAFQRRLADQELAATATIIVNYNGSGWTTEAQNAFEYAADIWETLITSPQPIIVDAQFGPMDSGVLGGAGPTRIWRNFSNAPQANTWYPVATANKLANTDLSPGLADINATFSSSYPNWHFGTGSSTPTNKISFTSVVLHELGHGLGFLGSMRVNGSIGVYGYSGSPMIYDRFTENGGGTPLLSYSNNSTALRNQLTSNNIFFDSTGGNFANGGSRVPIYAPSTWNQGSSYSHLGESFNPTAHALMTYSIAQGETIHNPGSVTLCMFAEMGWTVGQSCGVTAISGLAASNDGPTVLGNSTQLTATISAGSGVTYEWDFGDGGSNTGAVVSHQYASPGIYTAEVTASNSVNSDTATTMVYVDQAIGGLAASNDGPTVLGDPTQLTASISTGSNVTYEWDFGDGTDGNGVVISHQYASPGTYTAEVTATNSLGQATATTQVQVDESETAISGLSATNNGPTILGNTTQLSASISAGSGVTYEWNFGDGNLGNGQVVFHKYAAAGIYSAEVTATNFLGQEKAATQVQVLEITSRVYIPMLVKP
jgi:PKD repeat protein